MGAGKSQLGQELARLTERPFVDTDEEIEKRFGPIGELFERGEPEFRRIEEQVVAEALAGPTAVIALGGGAILSETTQERLASSAFVALVEVDVDTAWERVKEKGRPLAQDREQFEIANNEHPYANTKKQFVFIYKKNVTGVDLHYNTNLMDIKKLQKLIQSAIS